MITLNLYKSCLDPATRHSNMTMVAYSEDAFAAAGIEAGNAIQKIETVMWAQSMALQGNLLAARDEAEVELIAQGMFGEGGFFANIWKAIADAFRAIGNFIGNLFGKLTQATEKNLKALKEAVTLLTANSKFQIIASGDTNKGRMKKGASVKVPKAPLLAPCLISTLEINGAYTTSDKPAEGFDTEAPLSQLAGLKLGNKLVYTFFNKTLSTATIALDNDSGGSKTATKDVEVVNTDMNAMRADQNIKWYDGDGVKGVSQAITNFVKNILTPTSSNTNPEYNSLKGILLNPEITDDNIKKIFKENVSSNGKIHWDNSAKAIQKLVASDRRDKLTTNELATVRNSKILALTADIKGPSKPEDVTDITKYYKEQFAVSGEVTAEDNTILVVLAVVLHCANLLLEPTTYNNLEKYFKDGKEKFMKLAEKYDDKAKEFKASAISAANANSDQQNRRNLGNSVSNLTATGSDLSKLTKWFSQLSLKWYQTIDQMTSIAIGNTYNAVVVLTKSLESNTVEFV